MLDFSILLVGLNANAVHLETFSTLTLSGICIAIAYVLIHLRIMEILRVERTFGPLQVRIDAFYGLVRGTRIGGSVRMYLD